jgi:O-antigen ligase
MLPLQAAVLALVALILAPGYFFYFDITPKTVVLLSGTGLILLISALARKTELHRVPALFSVLFLLDVISLTTSTALSIHPALSLFGSTWRSFGCLAQAAILLFTWLVAQTCAGRPQSVRAICRVVTLAGIVSALYGILQYAGWDPLLPAAAYHVGDGTWTIVRAPGTFGYASYFATWLLFVIFLGLAQHSMEESRSWRQIAAAGAILASIAMILTGTRAAVLGLLAGAAVWAALKRLRITWRQGGALCLVALCAAAFYYSPPGQQLRSRGRWFAEDPWGGARLNLWRDSLRMASHRLPTGYGPEVFTGEFPHFESAALAKAYPDFAHESPHNILIDSLVSQGIPGFLILLALCADGFRRAWRLKAAPFAAALAAGIVSQQFTAFTIPTALIFFTTLACLAALEAQPARVRQSLVFAGFEAAAACALLYFATRIVVADHALALAKRGIERQDLAAAAGEYGIYDKYRLPGGSADLWFSRAMLNLALQSNDSLIRTGATLQSDAAAVEATQTSDNPFDAWYNLAVISGLHNNGSRAEECLRAAITANPNWYKPHWTLALVLRAEGRSEEAYRQAAVAEQLGGRSHREVAETLRVFAKEQLQE